MDTQERIDKIHQLLHLQTLSFLELGALFKDSEDAGDHSKMGYKRITQFLAGYFNIKPQRVYQIRQVYKTFIGYISADPSLNSIDVTRLRQLAPFVKPDTPKETVLEYLHEAKTKTSRDYIAWINTLQGKPDQLTCEHPETITRCKICKMKLS